MVPSPTEVYSRQRGLKYKHKITKFSRMSPSLELWTIQSSRYPDTSPGGRHQHSLPKEVQSVGCGGISRV